MKHKESELDPTALKNACNVIARNTKWDRRPVDVASTDILASAFEQTALGFQEFVLDQGRDPNLIVRTVEYLQVHAMPPMRDDISWFTDMLTALIELTCPNFSGSPEHEDFYRDIEEGIAQARADYE
jgi:hypothetical protein